MRFLITCLLLGYSLLGQNQDRALRPRHPALPLPFACDMNDLVRTNDPIRIGRYVSQSEVGIPNPGFVLPRAVAPAKALPVAGAAERDPTDCYGCDPKVGNVVVPGPGPHTHQVTMPSGAKIYVEMRIAEGSCIPDPEEEEVCNQFFPCLLRNDIKITSDIEDLTIYWGPSQPPPPVADGYLPEGSGTIHLPGGVPIDGHLYIGLLCGGPSMLMVFYDGSEFAQLEFKCTECKAD
jgi:hypothetical protein